MRNPYYIIWADAIQSIRRNHPNKKDWKITIFILITLMQSLNLWVICLWLKYFGVNIPVLTFDGFMPGTIVNGFIGYTLQFALPFIVLNMFFIFHKNRYEKIVKEYKYLEKHKVRYSGVYTISVALGAFVSAVLYGILT